MITVLTVLHLVSCIFIILLVLLQSGKGAEVSASFGGSSSTVFGSSGGANFFTKLTWALAGIFAVTSLLLTIGGTPQGIVEKTLGGQQAPLSVPVESTTPVGATSSPEADTPPPSEPVAEKAEVPAKAEAPAAAEPAKK